MERRGVTPCGGVENVYRGKDGVGIDSGATTASICGKITTGGVSVGLDSIRSMRQSRGDMKYACLLETKDTGCFGKALKSGVPFTEPRGEGDALLQRPVLNGSREEGRRVGFFP